MDNKKKLGFNILGLLRAFNESQGKLAKTLDISASYISEIVNGKKEPDRPLLEKLAKHFGLSPESLMNEDYSGIQQTTFFHDFALNPAKLLPLFESKASLSNKDFSDALAAQKEAYNAEENGNLLLDLDSLINSISGRYSKIKDKSIVEEAAANTLSFTFWMMLCIKANEMLADYKNHKESYPLQVTKFIENNPKTKDNIDEILKMDNDFPIDENAYHTFVNDPAFDETINELVHALRKTDNKWNDLVDYYIALEFIFGAVNNAFSTQQNHDFGIELMLKYAKIGNTYAESYVSTMIIPV